MIDDATFTTLSEAAFRKVEDLFEDIDVAVVDCERAGDVLTLGFAGGIRCVLNTQRPTRQLWLAAKARAWHFRWDEGSKSWVDEKDPSHELFARVRALAVEHAGLELP